MTEHSTDSVNPKRWVLVGDLDWIEYAIADYIAMWGEHLTGQPYIGEFGPNIAGIPTAAANMAMTVIRKNIEPAAELDPTLRRVRNVPLHQPRKRWWRRG